MKPELKPDENTVDRVRRVDWFSKTGELFTNTISMPVVLATGWPDVEWLCAEGKWEATILEARNALTEHLDDRCCEEYQEWNNLAVIARDVVAEAVTPAVSSFIRSHDLSENILNCVHWDIANAIMEASYARFRPPRFFLDLLNVYEAGHFPCGWQGEWPSGKLIVY